MKAGMQRAEHRDNHDNAGSRRDLDRDVVAQLKQRAADYVNAFLLHKLRNQPLAIGGREHDHAEEHCDFLQKETAVIRFGQCRQGAREIPRVDRAGDDERCDADDTETGKAQRGRTRDRDRDFVAARSGQQHEERWQCADPGRRGKEMQNIGRGMHNGFAAQSARRMPGPSQCCPPTPPRSLPRDRRARTAWLCVPKETAQTSRQDRRPGQPDKPVMSEGCLRQHRPQHAVGNDVDQRLIAHRRRGQNSQPRRRSPPTPRRPTPSSGSSIARRRQRACRRWLPKSRIGNQYRRRTRRRSPASSRRSEPRARRSEDHTRRSPCRTRPRSAITGCRRGR